MPRIVPNINPLINVDDEHLIHGDIIDLGYVYVIRLGWDLLNTVHCLNLRLSRYLQVYYVDYYNRKFPIEWTRIDEHIYVSQ